MKKIDTSEAIEFLSSYKEYQSVVQSLKIAKKYYVVDEEPFEELIAEYEKQMKLIEDFVKSFAPSKIFIILDLHYLQGIPLDKVFECMGMSRSSFYRYLHRARIALDNRYKRMKGEIKCYEM